MGKNIIKIRICFMWIFLICVFIGVGISTEKVKADQEEVQDDIMISDTWYDNYMYDLDEENKVIVLNRYKGGGEVVFVPSRACVNDVEYKTAVSGNVFANIQGISEVSFDQNVIVYSLYGMFYDCHDLVEADLSNADFSELFDMDSVFAGCYLLNNVKFGDFETNGSMSAGISSDVKMSMRRAFYNCRNIAAVDLSRFDMSKVLTVDELFTGCTKLVDITTPHKPNDLLGISLPKKMGMEDAGRYCTVFYTDLMQAPSNCRIVAANEWYYDYTFEFNEDETGHELTLIKYIGYDSDLIVPAKIKIGNNEYKVCLSGANHPFTKTSVESVVFEDGVKCKDEMSSMFSGCPKLKKVDFGEIDTSECTRMDAVFSGCSLLEEVNMAGFDMSNVKSAVEMFYGADNIRMIKTPKIGNTNLMVNLKHPMYVKNENGVLEGEAYTDLMKMPALSSVYTKDKDFAELSVGVGQIFYLSFNPRNNNTSYIFECDDGCDLHAVLYGTSSSVTPYGASYSVTYSLRIDTPGLHCIGVYCDGINIGKKIVYADIEIKKHTVNLTQKSGGRISADKTTAFVGETVNLTKSPSSGYTFSKWVVKDSNGENVEVNYKNQFTMPDLDVTVYAVFNGGTRTDYSDKDTSNSTDSGSNAGGAPGSSTGNSNAAEEKTSDIGDNRTDRAVSENTALKEDVLPVTGIKQPSEDRVGESIESGDIEYMITGTGEAMFVSKQRSSKRMVIPHKVKLKGKTYKITSVAENAFKDNKKLTSIVIGKNVASIGEKAFSGCVNLKKVVIGEKVRKISPSAFSGCTSLKTISVRSKVLTKGNVKDSLKGSSIKNIKLAGKARKIPLKRYGKIFSKSNSGRSVRVSR